MSATTIERSERRRVTRLSRGVPTSDGAGVKLTRMLGDPALPDLDPFLMLDQIRSDERDDYIAGFPEHPHRGFETVTIMIDGKMRHGDNKGHSGVIEGGGVQWMTAGRGIVHSEIPEQEDGRLWGFQLWVNLPAEHKMTDPRYQEFSRDEIPIEARPGASVRVLAGETASGVLGPATSAATKPMLLDVALEPGAAYEETVPVGHAAFIAVYQGSVKTEAEARGESGDIEIVDPHLAVFGDGDRVALEAGGFGARFLLIAGAPLNEPVAKYGPFLMNTEAELRQAITDFQAGRF
ncbi:MAG: pirin family protein [Pseudomonadota bacterium]